MVSRGVSRGESLASLNTGDEVGQKIEELIEQKSRSIVNVITQNQMSQFYNIYSHPYSAATQIPYSNIPIGMYNSVGTGSNSDFFQGQSPYQGLPYPSLGSRANQEVIEMTICESDERTSHNLSMRDHHQESSPNLANHLEKSGQRSHQHEESKKSLIKQSSSSEFT